MGIQFSSKKDALMLPACEPDSKTPYAWYKHATQPGFYVRASKADAKGKFDRVYFHRYKTQEDDGAGGAKTKEHRDQLGPVVQGTQEEFNKIVGKLLKKREELKADVVEGASTRLTVAGAWAFYATEKHINKSISKDKDAEQYQRYLSHLAGRYLDELPNAFWTEFQKQLREGTLIVGQRERKDGRGTEPVLRGPLADATLGGALKTAAVLYEIANKYAGLKPEMAGQNPPRKALELVKSPNKRTAHIALRDLGTAWRASDQLISPWWRDLFRVFVLTGLRRSLLFAMRFDQIDFDNGIYTIDPRQPGAKRRADKILPSTPDIRMPLSKFVLGIISARREFAPDKEGLVWFTPKPTRGRRTKADKQALSDPRGAWTLIEWAINDFHFSPHDLRRTFATAGSMATRDLYDVSLLMLHSGGELAKAAGVPGITLQYVDTDEAVERMREAAEEITSYVLKLAAMPVAQAQKIEDPTLHQDLEAALSEAA